MNWITRWITHIITKCVDKDERVEPKVGTTEFEVLAVLRAFPAGCTDAELESVFSTEFHVAAARERLVGRGFVANSGRTRVNTTSGRENIVWVAI